MISLVFKRPATSTVLPILSALALVVTIGPLVWHSRNRNIPAVSLIAWVAILNTCSLINPLIWPTDDVFHWWNGAGLCDIEAKLLLMATAGIGGSLAAIIRNLAIVLDIKNAVIAPSRAQRRRKLFIDLALCQAGPTCIAATSWIVQSPRFGIFTTMGCVPLVVNSWPSVVICFIWPPLLAMISGVYSILVVWRIAKYRQQFRSILSRSSSGLNRSRFYRLLILALILLLVYLPVTIYTLYANSLGMDRFVWSEAHGPEWGQIPKVPTGGLVGFDRWIALGTGILIFLFFGLGKDAKEMYSGWAIKLGLRRLMTRLGATKATTQPMTDTQLSLDSRVRLWHGQKSDSYPQRSMSSLTDHVSFTSRTTTGIANRSPVISMTFETRVWSEEPAIQALCKSPADEEAQAITVEMELEQISEAR